MYILHIRTFTIDALRREYQQRHHHFPEKKIIMLLLRLLTFYLKDNLSWFYLNEHIPTHVKCGHWGNQLNESKFQYNLFANFLEARYWYDSFYFHLLAPMLTESRAERL